jgi:hypothetical protein
LLENLVALWKENQLVEKIIKGNGLYALETKVFHHQQNTFVDML